MPTSASPAPAWSLFRALRARLAGQGPLRLARENDPRLARTPLREGFGCGLIGGAQVQAYANRLATGLSDAALEKHLGESWSIEDRTAALLALAGLVLGRHCAAYAGALSQLVAESGAVLLPPGSLEGAALDGLPAAVIEPVRAGMALDGRDLQGRVRGHLAKSFRGIGTRRHGRFTPAQFARGVSAWDLGRLATLARLCCDARLLDAAERDAILEWTGRRVLEQYRSWDEVAVAYLIGRACTRGADLSFHALTETTCDLLEDPRSPWVLRPLR